MRQLVLISQPTNQPGAYCFAKELALRPQTPVHFLALGTLDIVVEKTLRPHVKLKSFSFIKKRYIK